MTIRKKILLALLGFSVIPLLASLIINMFQNVRTIEALHLDRIDKLAHISASAFAEIVNLHKNELALFAQNEYVGDYIETRSEFGEGSMRDKRERRLLRAQLDTYLSTVNVFSNLVILDEAGAVEIASNDKLLGLDLSGFDYFQRVIENNDDNFVFVSKVHPSLSSPSDPSQNCLAISRILKDSGGKTQGVIVAFVNTDIMARFSRGISFGKTGIAFAIDSDNFILYHPESRFYNSYTTATNLQNLIERYNEGSIPESGIIYSDMSGVHRIYYYVVMPNDDLVLILRQDYSEYAQGREHAILVAVITLLLTVVVAIYFAVAFSRDFVKPILELKKAFDSGRDEGRYVVCSINTKDEIEEMAEGYNSMIQALECQFEEINEEKTKSEYIASHDNITTMYNRTAFVKLLNRDLKPGESYGVFFLDLDGFKQINDVMGHTFGDMLLHALGRRIDGSKAQFDVCSRLGGDEFLLYKSGGRKEMELCGQTLLDELRVPFDIEGRTLHMTCSIGVAMYPNDGDTVESLVKNADIAMYASKDKGKNMFTFYDKLMQNRIDRHSDIMNVLRDCIKNDEVFLEYHPEVDIETGETIAYEALMRIKSVKLGATNPEEFIPVAESDTAIINQLGRWALITACRFARRMIDEKGFKGVIAVNISIKQLHRDNFAEDVISILEQENLPANFLQLEITESVLMSDIGANVKKLSILRKKGVSVAMDDFGTNYSSFNYLIHLPLNVLKIDRSFFAGIENSKRMMHVNQSIVEVAHKLDLKVVAEGVETENQYNLVREIGCDVIQGYYFSRPMPDYKVMEWHDKHRNE